MIASTNAFAAVADLARAFETAVSDLTVSQGYVQRLQRQAERLATDATEAEYQARTFRRQGVKTRAKVRAQRDEIKALRAEVRALKGKLSFAQDQRAAYLRANRELSADLNRSVQSPDLARYYGVRVTESVMHRAIQFDSHAQRFVIQHMDLERIRSAAGVECIAKSWGRKVGDALGDVYAKALKEGLGIR